MKKKIIIIAVIVLALLGAGEVFYINWFQPRLEVYNAVQDAVPDVGEPFEYFTDFSIKNENTFTYENGHISVELPADFIEVEPAKYSSNTAEYERGENEWLWVVKPTVQNTRFFFATAKYSNKIPSPKQDAVKESIESFGLGYPEKAYDLFKAIYLLENEHYNFFDLDAAKTFLFAGDYKKDSFADETTLIYERDDIRGFIDIRDNGNPDENGNYTLSLRIFTTNDLDVRTVIQIRTDSIEEAYGIINSAKAVK